MNTMITRFQQAGTGFPIRNPYAINIDSGRNCYVYRGFGHIVQHCRNKRQRRRVAEGRRLEYGEREENNDYFDNLKEVENLESLD